MDRTTYEAELAGLQRQLRAELAELEHLEFNGRQQQAAQDKHLARVDALKRAARAAGLDVDPPPPPIEPAFPRLGVRQLGVRAQGVRINGDVDRLAPDYCIGWVNGIPVAAGSEARTYGAVMHAVMDRSNEELAR